MKHFYLPLILFFLLNTTANSTNKKFYDPNGTIQILNLVTNGSVQPNNTISFNGVNDLYIEFDVKLTYIGTDPDFINGQLSCTYYDPNSYDNEIAQYYNNGVLPRVLFTHKPTLISNGTNYTYTYHKKMHLVRHSIYNSGGSIVFRYRKDDDGSPWDFSRQFPKLTYRIIGGTKTGNEPSIPSVKNLIINSISYSNGMPLINNQVVVPDSGQQNDDEEPGTRSINLSFSYNCTLGTTDVGYYPSAKVQVSGRNSLDEPVWKDLTGWLSDTEFFATFSLTNLKIRSTEVADNSTVRIIFSFQGTEIYTCSLARPSRSIEFNNIYSSQTIQSGQTVQPFTSSQPNIWVTGGELECPYRIKCNDPKIYSNVTNYQWQIKQNSGNWTNLPNVTSKDYTPTNQFTSNTSYRRIAFYNGLYCMSLPIDIIVAAPVVNSICCTQNLPTYNSQPQPITGNIPALNGNFSYQWQIAPNLYNPMVWQNINGATSQNYTHIFTNPALRGTLVTTFRRLLIQNGSTINISNEITVNRPNRTAKYINTEDNDMLLTDSDVLIYPNPVSNLLNVEFEDGSSTPEKILIYDISGREINLNIITNSENQIQLDFSGVSSGTYYLKFENAEKLITKKIIKNN